MPFLPIGRLNENFLNRQKLMELFTMPQVKEALYVASPVLYDEMCKAMEDSYGIPQKDIIRQENSFARYVSRMATRCTPFGLFAGCAVGSIGRDTEIEVEEGIIRHARLDMDYLYNFIRK